MGRLRCCRFVIILSVVLREVAVWARPFFLLDGSRCWIPEPTCKERFEKKSDLHAQS